MGFLQLSQERSPYEREPYESNWIHKKFLTLCLRLLNYDRPGMSGIDGSKRTLRSEIHCLLRSNAAPIRLSLAGRLARQELRDPLVWLNTDLRSPHRIFVDGQPGPVPDFDAHTIEAHTYVDGSLAEIILNKALACTKRFTYAGSEVPVVTFRVEGHPDSLGMSTWQIAPISPRCLAS